jgi:hypothetical protein
MGIVIYKKFSIPIPIRIRIIFFWNCNYNSHFNSRIGIPRINYLIGSITHLWVWYAKRSKIMLNCLKILSKNFNKFLIFLEIILSYHIILLNFSKGLNNFCKNCKNYREIEPKREMEKRLVKIIT